MQVGPEALLDLAALLEHGVAQACQLPAGHGQLAGYQGGPALAVHLWAILVSCL